MILRVVTATLLLVIATGCVSPSRSKVWNSASAAADAQRDLAAGRVRFAYVGGYVSRAPGVPEDPATLALLERYHRLEVGPQGCIQDEHRFERAEYARRYNRVMWSYLFKQR
jgi:hypothetical protein